jgi:L-asparaginase/Glu-tRNA(Gln) amidotransferase subunit D
MADLGLHGVWELADAGVNVVLVTACAAKETRGPDALGLGLVLVERLEVHVHQVLLVVQFGDGRDTSSETVIFFDCGYATEFAGRDWLVVVT